MMVRGLVLENSILALTSRFRFLFPFHTGLLVMLAFPNLSQNAGTRALALESSQSALQGFVFPNTDFRHLYPSPPLISEPNRANKGYYIPFPLVRQQEIWKTDLVFKTFTFAQLIRSDSFAPPSR